jgi:divalent metal cation (Fe/Co/Zn/Cd) transporter
MKLTDAEIRLIKRAHRARRLNAIVWTLAVIVAAGLFFANQFFEWKSDYAGILVGALVIFATIRSSDKNREGLLGLADKVVNSDPDNLRRFAGEPINTGTSDRQTKM